MVRTGDWLGSGRGKHPLNKIMDVFKFQIIKGPDISAIDPLPISPQHFEE
jgi:hypothetical protein